MTMTTTTARTSMMTTTRRGKFSTASSVLLLCTILLLTKSLGILALSGDGNSIQLPGQADAWSETTTVSEGSGWEVTTDQAEYTKDQEELTTPANGEIDTTIDAADPEVVETTVSPNEPEPEPETTAQPIVEESSSSTSQPIVETTVASEENKPTEVTKEEQPTTVPSEDKPTTVVTPEQPTTVPSEDKPTTVPTPEQPTTVPTPEQPTTVPNEENQPTTTPEVITTIAPTPPAPPAFECQAAGFYPHVSGDCQRFHNCLLDPISGQLLGFEMLCPPSTAFSPTYKRCLRDVSTCTDDAFTCVAPGRFAGSDDSFYYNCLPSTQGGFHKYIVRCSSGTRFEPMLGRCWRYDWTQFVPGQLPQEYGDLAAIKREQKDLKAEDKLIKKAQKNKEKEALKQQKQAEKAAKKAAKEAAKKAAKENKPLSIESAESVEQQGYGF